MELSIVIPVYNSSSILLELCNQIDDALSDNNYEVILVNDGSNDDSWNVIEQITTHHSNAGSVTLRESIPQSCHNPVLASTDNSGLMARSLNY